MLSLLPIFFNTALWLSLCGIFFLSCPHSMNGVHPLRWTFQEEEGVCGVAFLLWYDGPYGLSRTLGSFKTGVWMILRSQRQFYLFYFAGCLTCLCIVLWMGVWMGVHCLCWAPVFGGGCTSHTFLLFLCLRKIFFNVKNCAQFYLFLYKHLFKWKSVHFFNSFPVTE